MGDRLLNVSQVKEILCVSKSYVYQLIDIGELPAYNVAKRNGLRVYKSTLDKYIKKSKVSFK